MSGKVARTAGYALVIFRQQQQLICFRLRGGQRFLDQHVDAGFHQGTGNVEVLHGGNRDGRGLHFAVRGEHLFDRAESFAVKFVGDCIGNGRVGIDYSD